MLDFIKENALVKHFLIACASVGILFFIVLKFISSYTLHGEIIVVPNLVAKSMAEVISITEQSQLRYVVVDSVFDPKKVKGTVLDQDPSANFKVKQNRTIYLTICAFNPPKVQMPNLVDVSLRQATSMLETYGLEVGRLTYVPDFAKNAVLKQLYKGAEIKAGDLISKQSKIDLVLGDGGLKGDKVEMPNLLGLTRSAAILKLNVAGLNIGVILPDNTVKDTLNAIVYKQTPAYTAGLVVKSGKQVDLFITQDPAKIEAAKDTLTSTNLPE